MLKKPFLERLKRGETLIGTVLTLPSTEIAELLSESGFDWLFVDTEHAALDIRDVQSILQTAHGRCPCIVRAPSMDEVWIKRILDAGPAGIMIPQVNSVEEAQKIVRLCRYPPGGSRSVGISRAHTYGMKFQEYVDSADETSAVIVQIEHVEAIRNSCAIACVPGIDALFVGPYDLSGSLGKIGKVTDPEVKQHIEVVTKVHTDTGKPIGIWGNDAESVKPYIDQGYTLIAIGMDTMFLWKSAHHTLKTVRGL